MHFKKLLLYLVAAILWTVTSGALKLTHVINWSWPLILAPVLVPMAVIGLIVFLIEVVLSRLQRGLRSM